MNQAYCHNMYPRKIDSGNATQNLNLSLNWKLPASPHAARAACMASPSEYNYTVDITHEQSLAWMRQHVAHQVVQHISHRNAV